MTKYLHIEQSRGTSFSWITATSLSAAIELVEDRFIGMSIVLSPMEVKQLKEALKWKNKK